MKRPAYLKTDDKSYEFEAITNYVKKYKKSPITGKPATLADIVEIPMMLKIVEGFKTQQVWFDEDQ